MQQQTVIERQMKTLLKLIPRKSNHTQATKTTKPTTTNTVIFIVCIFHSTCKILPKYKNKKKSFSNKNYLFKNKKQISQPLYSNSILLQPVEREQH